MLRLSPMARAAALAHVASAVMFISMAATINASKTTEEIVDEIAHQLRAVLPRQ